MKNLLPMASDLQSGCIISFHDSTRRTFVEAKITQTWLNRSNRLAVSLLVLRSTGGRPYLVGETTWRLAQRLLWNGGLRIKRPEQEMPTKIHPQSPSVNNTLLSLNGEDSKKNNGTPFIIKEPRRTEVRVLRIPEGEQKCIVFIDSSGILVKQHYIRLPDRKIWEPCPQTEGKPCPLCIAGNPAYWRAFFSVIDECTPGVVRLWSVEPHVADVIQAEQKRRGGSLNTLSFLVRNPKDYPSLPDMWIRFLGKSGMIGLNKISPIDYAAASTPKSYGELSIIASLAVNKRQQISKATAKKDDPALAAAIRIFHNKIDLPTE